MKAVVLRDVKEQDLPVFYEHQRDVEAARMAAFPSREWDAYAAHWAKILADPTNQKQTILYNGEVAGNILGFEMEGKREVGYWIGREFWGKGIATLALEAFLRQVSTRPLYAHTAKSNAASRRVLEKCGFVLTGEDSWQPDPNGAPVEEYVFVLHAPG